MMRLLSKCLWTLLCVAALSAAPMACGDDDSGPGGGTAASAADACKHYCTCSFAAVIPSCQSTCESGASMASDPSACTKCTKDKSCTDLQAQGCQSACSQ